MKVSTEYGGFQKNSYEQKHSHNITDCQHKETEKKQAGAPLTEDMRTGNPARKYAGNVIYEKSPDFHMPQTEVKKEKNAGLSLLKGLWDSLGEEKEKGREEGKADERLSFSQGVWAAASAFKEGIAERLLNKWEAVKERIKTEVSASLKRFSRNGDTFAALSDQGTASHKQNSSSEREAKAGEALAGKEKRDTPMRPLVNSHLTDSYSKTGAYCRLGENITYQKPVGGKAPERKKK